MFQSSSTLEFQEKHQNSALNILNLLRGESLQSSDSQSFPWSSKSSRQYTQGNHHSNHRSLSTSASIQEDSTDHSTAAISLLSLLQRPPTIHSTIEAAPPANPGEAQRQLQSSNTQGKSLIHMIKNSSSLSTVNSLPDDKMFSTTTTLHNDKHSTYQSIPHNLSYQSSNCHDTIISNVQHNTDLLSKLLPSLSLPDSAPKELSKSQLDGVKHQNSNLAEYHFPVIHLSSENESSPIDHHGDNSPRIQQLCHASPGLTITMPTSSRKNRCNAITSTPPSSCSPEQGHKRYLIRHNGSPTSSQDSSLSCSSASSRVSSNTTATTPSFNYKSTSINADKNHHLQSKQKSHFANPCYMRSPDPNLIPLPTFNSKSPYHHVH